MEQNRGVGNRLKGVVENLQAESDRKRTLSEAKMVDASFHGSDEDLFKAIDEFFKVYFLNLCMLPQKPSKSPFQSLEIIARYSETMDIVQKIPAPINVKCKNFSGWSEKMEAFLGTKISPLMIELSNLWERLSAHDNVVKRKNILERYNSWSVGGCMPFIDVVRDNLEKIDVGPSYESIWVKDLCRFLFGSESGRNFLYYHGISVPKIKELSLLQCVFKKNDQEEYYDFLVTLNRAGKALEVYCVICQVLTNDDFENFLEYQVGRCKEWVLAFLRPSFFVASVQKAPATVCDYKKVLADTNHVLNRMEKFNLDDLKSFNVCAFDFKSTIKIDQSSSGRPVATQYDSSDLFIRSLTPTEGHGFTHESRGVLSAVEVVLLEIMWENTENYLCHLFSHEAIFSAGTFYLGVLLELDCKMRKRDYEMDISIMFEDVKMEFKERLESNNRGDADDPVKEVIFSTVVNERLNLLANNQVIIFLFLRMLQIAHAVFCFMFANNVTTSKVGDSSILDIFDIYCKKFDRTLSGLQLQDMHTCSRTVSKMMRVVIGMDNATKHDVANSMAMANFYRFSADTLFGINQEKMTTASLTETSPSKSEKHRKKSRRRSASPSPIETSSSKSEKHRKKLHRRDDSTSSTEITTEMQDATTSKSEKHHRDDSTSSTGITTEMQDAMDSCRMLYQAQSEDSPAPETPQKHKLMQSQVSSCSVQSSIHSCPAPCTPEEVVLESSCCEEILASMGLVLGFIIRDMTKTTSTIFSDRFCLRTNDIFKVYTEHKFKSAEDIENMYMRNLGLKKFISLTLKMSGFSSTDDETGWRVQSKLICKVLGDRKKRTEFSLRGGLKVRGIAVYDDGFSMDVLDVQTGSWEDWKSVVFEEKVIFESISCVHGRKEKVQNMSTALERDFQCSQLYELVRVRDVDIFFRTVGCGKGEL